MILKSRLVLTLALSSDAQPSIRMKSSLWDCDTTKYDIVDQSYYDIRARWLHVFGFV
jgi:hypothetical protein